MGAARFLVSFELLRQCLCLPTATTLKFVSTADDDLAEIIVTHPDLPDAPFVEGEKPPLVCPTFRKQEPVVFVDWGQQ